VLSDQEIVAADKYFAVEGNNLAWKLLEQGGPSDATSIREILDAAHASAFHWERCGEPVNALRAAYLLTTVYTRLGWAQSALWHAQETHTMLLGLPDEATIFDRAASLTALSQAFELADKPEEAAMFQLDADSHLDSLALEERAIIQIYWAR
jgi:hypothetical protein